jgi:DNA-binding response OmpR family regulator
MPKILVVEDERHVRELLVDLLDDAGYEVIEAADGEAALQQASHQHPDIIILDLMLPLLDGFQVLERLKGNPGTSSIPVIVATARDQKLDELKARTAGAADYISKPWQHGEVESKVRNVEFSNRGPFAAPDMLQAP